MYQYCPAFHGIAIRQELTEDDKRLLSRLRCKSWSCPFCASGNRNRWRAFLLDVLPSISEVWSFHTLTLPSWVRANKEYSSEDRTIASLSLIRANWDKIMKRIKRQLGSNVQYFRVFEKHLDGCLHVHFLLSHWIPEVGDCGEQLELRFVDKGDESYYYWPFLKTIAPECGFGYISSSENIYIDPKKTVGYVTKYMTKEDFDINQMLSKYRIRRFQSSQGIGSQEKWGQTEDFWEVRSFIDSGMISQQNYHDNNIGLDISQSMLGKMGEYPPNIQYQKAQEEQKRRNSLKD